MIDGGSTEIAWNDIDAFEFAAGDKGNEGQAKSETRRIVDSVCARTGRRVVLANAIVVGARRGVGVTCPTVLCATCVCVLCGQEGGRQSVCLWVCPSIGRGLGACVC